MREPETVGPSSFSGHFKATDARCWPLLVVGLAVAILPGGLARADDVEMERFRNECPQALERLERAYSEIKGECQVIERAGLSGRRWVAEEIRFESSGELHKATIKENAHPELNPRPHVKVLSYGEEDGFSILKPPGESNFRIASVRDARRTKGSHDNKVGRALNAPFSVFVLPLSQILKFPTCRLLSAESFNRAGKSLTRVRLTYGDPGKPQPVTLELDPSACWAIARSEFYFREGPGSAGEITEIEYGPQVDGIPTLKSVKILEVSPSSPTPPKVFEFQRFEFGPTPPEEFTLSYYGLPNMATPSKSGGLSAPAFWLFSLGAAGVGLWLILRGVSRRWRTAA